jgi:hypothetical protein
LVKTSGQPIELSRHVIQFRHDGAVRNHGRDRRSQRGIRVPRVEDQHGSGVAQLRGLLIIKIRDIRIEDVVGRYRDAE